MWQTRVGNVVLTWSIHQIQWYLLSTQAHTLKGTEFRLGPYATTAGWKDRNAPNEYL